MYVIIWIIWNIKNYFYKMNMFFLYVFGGIFLFFIFLVIVYIIFYIYSYS